MKKLEVSAPLSTILLHSNEHVQVVISIIIPIVIVVLLLFLIGIFLFTVFVIAITLIINRIKAKQLIITSQQSNVIVQELMSKEFKIEAGKIDFVNSVLLGSGASGSVITAKYYNHDVAVKIIQLRYAGVENDLSEFYNELKFLNSNTQHQNIIRFFGMYEDQQNNTIGLVMELCNNGSIANYITKHSNLSFFTKVKLLQGIANGMQYLHYHNIAHRNLKCENVLLDSNLQPKIIDFGYSKVIQEDFNKSLNLTMNIRTAAYCAPEVIKSQIVDFSSQQISSTSISQTNNESSMKSDILSSNRLAYDKKCDVYSFAICIWVIYFQNKSPYGLVADNQILFQLSKNSDFRPKIDESTIPEQEKWLIELMKQCWKTNSNERPSFEQICNILCQ